MEPGRTCWRIENAAHFSVIIDAEDYYRTAHDAMLRATKSIMLVGWDFDARIRLNPARPEADIPDRLGDFVPWLVRRQPDLEVRLLQWNSGRLRDVFRAANLWYLLRWKLNARVTARLDSTHPPLASHHQKLLVVDDSLAFCGGIDMTMKRWDTRAHADVEPLRTAPSGEQLQPWHDMTSVFDGEAALAIGDLCRQRWRRACGETLPPVKAQPVAWPQDIATIAGPVQIGIARSMPEMVDQTPVREVEDLFLAMIASAKTLIYAESQYFAARRIASAIARRLDEVDGPEVVIICPAVSEGWLEPIAMDTARARLVASLANRDHRHRLALYHPVTQNGNPIYVHAKLMIVDDRVLRVGSSNLNNRSLRLDSECDVVIDADQDTTGTIAANIRSIRHDLLAEHLGCTAQTVADCHISEGSLIRCIEALRGSGRSLVPYQMPEISALEAWLADNEVLDPEGPAEVFEYPSKRGLFRGRLRRPRDA